MNARALEKQLRAEGEIHVHLVSMTSGGFRGWRLVIAAYRTKVCADKDRCLRRAWPGG
jgi:hypothetical protein